MKIVITKKPSAKALKNEITATIMHPEKNENYHETFIADLTTNKTFEYKSKKYEMPKQDTTHYNPSFWNIPARMAIFFERHKTMALFLDWFRLRKRAMYEVGYLYWESTNNEDKAIIPLEIKSPNYDYAKECYMLRHNTSIEGSFAETDAALTKPKNNMLQWAMIMGIIVIVIVGIAVFANMFLGHDSSQAIQNATSTPFPSVIIK